MKTIGLQCAFLALALILNSCYRPVYSSYLDNLIRTGDWVPLPSDDVEIYSILRISMKDYVAVDSLILSIDAINNYMPPSDDEDNIGKTLFIDQYITCLKIIKEHDIVNHVHRSKVVREGFVYRVIYDKEAYYYSFEINSLNNGLKEFDNELKPLLFEFSS